MWRGRWFRLDLELPGSPARAILALASLGLLASSPIGISLPAWAEPLTPMESASDLRPSDWAYQALQQLTEQVGCLAGFPGGTDGGARSLSRFEAAALLRACLERVSEHTDQVERLLQHFQAELAILRGRADVLEAQVAGLEATQFSTTSKLSGVATFDLGAYGYGGTAKRGNSGPGGVENLESAFTLNYEVRLIFDSSFTGKDLLRTRLRSGNYGSSAFNGNQYRATKLVKSYQSSAGPDVVDVDRIYYSFPLSSAWKATVGPRVRNTEMLAIEPTAYKSSLGDFLSGTFGASGTYNKETGAGAGVIWRQSVRKGQPYLTSAVNYVAKNAEQGDPEAGGILTNRSGGSLLGQLGLVGPGWGLVAAYRYGQCGTDLRMGTQYTYAASKTSCDQLRAGAATNNLALNGYWQPQRSGWIPSISMGWGFSQFTEGYEPAINIRQAQSWMVGLQWSDVLVQGNRAGMAVGSLPYATASFDGQTPRDGNTTWEWWYDWRISDAMSLTPALFYQSRPAGQTTPQGESFNALGGLIRLNVLF